jgi:LEA14-like dessication related protein
MRLRFISVFVSLLVLISSCSSFKEPIIKGSDDFKLTQFEGKKISFSLALAIENNNWYALKIKPSNVDLYLEDKLIGKLHLLEKVTIPAKKTSEVVVPARIDLADGALFSLFKLVAKSEVNLRLTGKVKGGVFVVYKNFSVDEKWKVPTSLLKFDQLKLGRTFGLEK